MRTFVTRGQLALAGAIIAATVSGVVLNRVTAQAPPPSSTLPPIFHVGARVCTVRPGTAQPGETFQVEQLHGEWVRVRGLSGATVPYWIFPPARIEGFVECPK